MVMARENLSAPPYTPIGGITGSSDLFCLIQVLARKDDDSAANGYEGGVELVLDQTAEFCRGLGEVEEILQHLNRNVSEKMQEQCISI